MGEDVSGMATTTSQLQEKLLALTGGQVDIMLDANTFKNSTQILREMADAWEDMTDIQRASALELMGGKRQANVLSALIQNFDTVEDVIETSANSAGSALKENERYLDSIQGKIDQFNNAMQAMWSDTLDSDVVKSFVELATQLIKIVDAVGPLNIALVGFFTFLEKKQGFLSNFFTPAEEGIEALKKQLEQAEKDLAKATDADLQRGSKKTAQKRRDAQERVDIIHNRINTVDPDLADLINQKDALVKEINTLKFKRNMLSEFKEDKDVDGMSILVKDNMPAVREQISEYDDIISHTHKQLSKLHTEFDHAYDNGYDDSILTTLSNNIKSNRSMMSDLIDDRAHLIRESAKTLLDDMDNAIEENDEKLKNITAAINAKTTAQKADNIATEEGASVDAVASVASDGKTASTWQEVWATAASKDATFAEVGAKLKQLLITKLLSMEYVKNKILTGELTAAKLAEFTMTELLTLGMKGLVASLWAGAKAAVAFLVSLGPVVWTIVGIAAVVALLVAGFSACYKTTAELKEELDNMKSKLSDLRNELSSVNDELETTNERMAELLAKDKLTFEEQEELDRLRQTNDELERRKDLLEEQEKHDAERVGRQAAKVVDSAKNDKDWWESKWLLGGGVTGLVAEVFGGFNDEGEEYKKNIQDYKKLKEKYDNAPSLKKQEKYQKKLDKETEKIDAYISELSEALDGVEYGDSDESDAALDYLAELQDTYAIVRGSKNAKTNAIKGLFNKDEFAETKTAIDGYVDALAKGDTNAAAYIGEIINHNTDLVKDLKTRGLEAQDAIDYFTKLGSEANYATIDGKIQEVSRAATTFESLLDGGLFKVDDVDIGLADLFDEEGKIVQTKLSQVFNDTSDQTREDITNLLEGSYEQIKNNKVDTERLLTGFGLKTAQQVLDIQNKLLGEQNLELFPNLEEEINGLIDTFSEFSKTVGGVVDALDTLKQARVEEAYSGYVSIETLENLMQYTDDYAKLIEVDETGALTVAADAEKILIGTRIEKIKTDAAAAVQTAQTNLEQAKYNAKAVNETGPVQEALTTATDALAGSWAFLGSLIGDVTGGNFSGMLGRASDAYNKSTSGRKEKRAQVNVSVEDAQETLDNALYQKKIADSLTIDNIKQKYSSEEASGGNKDTEDLAEDLFKKEMEYWENRIGANQSKYEQLQNEIDLLEKKGQKAGKDYYLTQSTIEEERLSLLEGQKAAAESYLKIFAEGSEEWFRKKPACWKTNRRNPLNCWNFLRALYTTTQG